MREQGAALLPKIKQINMKTTAFLSLAAAREVLPDVHWSYQILVAAAAFGVVAIIVAGISALWQIFNTDFDIGPTNLTLAEIIEDLEGDY